jgi:hypothetical protein
MYDRLNIKWRSAPAYLLDFDWPCRRHLKNECMRTYFIESINQPNQLASRRGFTWRIPSRTPSAGLVATVDDYAAMARLESTAEEFFLLRGAQGGGDL